MSPKPVARAADRRNRAQERTRDDIVEAAAVVFARAGFHGATMQAIAREAGFTAASLYTYFPGKAEIFEALVAQLKGTLLATFDQPLPSGLSLSQRLELLLQRQAQIVSARRDALLVIFQHDPSRQAERESHEEFIERLARFIEAGPEKLRVPPAEAGRLLFGMLHAEMLRALLSPGAPVLPDPARTVDLFLHGAARPARP